MLKYKLNIGTEQLFVNLLVPIGFLSLFPVAPTLEHRASVKRSVSLQFLNPKTVGMTPYTGDQSEANPNLI
jgi:hypothetical protein